MPEGQKVEEDDGTFGRPPLPGFSRNADMHTMETIWKQKCRDEIKYKEHCEANPTPPGQSFGRMGPFDVHAYSSYIHVQQPARSSTASSVSSAAPSRRSARSGSAGAVFSGGRKFGADGSERGASGGAAAAAAATLAAGAEIVAGSEAPRLLTGRSSGSLAPPETGQGTGGGGYMMPKYAITRYSMHHMTALEKDPSCRSAKNLRRVIAVRPSSGAVAG
mmetsp:Transcript_48367/g.103687  ORF Transcript_48367/g.103687 Transcript_48367/m.103687 type:complete len:219 (+) Transcript_48367:99-755(+)